jgi:hypothetical protein
VVLAAASSPPSSSFSSGPKFPKTTCMNQRPRLGIEL